MKDIIWRFGCIVGIPALLALLLVQPATAGQSDSEQMYTIGITQIVTHPALDANRKGFMDQMEQEGFVQGENVKYDIRNAEGDMSLASSIAQKFVSRDVDLILSIATPTSQACVNKIQGEDIPLVFGSVTDPVSAGLVESWERPGGNVTGVSDWADVGAQVELIRDIVPGVDRLGVVYNAGETNSKVQVQQLKEVAPEYGIEEVKEASVASSADIMTSAQSLMGRVDAVWVPTDNTVVSGFEALVKVCEDNQVPLFAADTATVKRGAIGTPGIDYYELGREDGKLAARILRGEEPGEIPVQRMEMNKLYLNPKAAERMGVSIPEEVLDRATDIVGE
jgi:putative ABC transport system substrate-binding protein